MPRQSPLLIAALLSVLAITGCEPSPAPDKPKEPAKPVGSTELRDAIQRPLDRAKAVDQKIEDEKAKEDQNIKDQGG